MQGLSVKINIIILILISFIVNSNSYAENPDELYRDGHFAEAEKEYRRMDMDNPKDIRFRYNKGCAAFQNSDYDTAEAAFSSVLRRTKNKEILFRSAYNLGNTAFSKNDFASAVEFCKQAVILKPDSTDARYNLELSLKKLDEEKQNQDSNNKKENSNQKDKDKNSKNNKDKKDSNGKEKNDKDLDEGDNMNDQGPSNEMNQEKNKKKPEASLDKQKAEALLDNIKEDRAKILEYQIPKEKQKADSGKNW